MFSVVIVSVRMVGVFTLNPESKSTLIPKQFLVEFEMTYFKK